jgi:thiamine biosynthesis lipoprotein
MGTAFVITVFAKNKTLAKAACDKAFKKIRELDNALSDYKDQSELNRLSRSSGSGKAIKVSEDLWQVLTLSQKVAAATGGAFDISCGPYVILWRLAGFRKTPPDLKKLKKLSEAVGYKKIKLDLKRKTVLLEAPLMRLDLGAIAKGYAADRALEELKAAGCPFAIVDAGGDLRGSSQQAGLAWPVKISYGSGLTIGWLKLKQGALASSGDTGQFFKSAGQHYSHIIDPRSGMALTKRLQVTVWAKTATEADALASALSVLGEKEGLAHVETLKNVEALFYVVKKEGNTVTKSSGFPDILDN